MKEICLKCQTIHVNINVITSIFNPSTIKTCNQHYSKKSSGFTPEENISAIKPETMSYISRSHISLGKQLVCNNLKFV